MNTDTIAMENGGSTWIWVFFLFFLLAAGGGNGFGFGNNATANALTQAQLQSQVQQLIDAALGDIHNHLQEQDAKLNRIIEVLDNGR